MTEVDAQPQDLELAQAAAGGEAAARAQVNALAHPLIDFHTRRFCRRFCHDNFRFYRCSLSQPIVGAPVDALLCEWGNASYGWMLDDLTRPARLQKYAAREGASLFDYLYRIANSLPFYERWKDWRFGRRVHLPTFISALSPHAARVFLAMRSGLTTPLIAQQLGLSPQQVENISIQIINTLTRKRKLYLLDAPQLQSLTETQQPGATTDHTIADYSTGAAGQCDISSEDEPAEQQEAHAQLQQAWAKLEPVEQFVLQALVIDELDARAVIRSLAAMDIALNKKTPADQTSVQQLYYFKRKALAKLGGLL